MSATAISSVPPKTGMDHVFLRLYGPRGWTILGVCAVVAFVVFPVLHLAVPADSAFHVSTFWVTLAGKIMCYAMVALALDLVWGYAGILSLGHGLFFALGGYGMGMYLMRQIGREGQYQSHLPDFMVFLDWKELPWQCWRSSSRGCSRSSSATSPSARA
jgi:urea transport system permease protein